MRTQTEHFAWLPIVVYTWRPKGTKALIWLQKYRIENDQPYRSEYKWTWYLGLLSYEFK